MNAGLKLVANVFGLCVSLPLHKCSNYRQMLIGQIAQNPCYMKVDFTHYTFIEARKRKKKNERGKF